MRNVNETEKLHTPTHSLTIGFHGVRFVLGMILLVAAGFKAWALYTDPSPALFLFSSPRWQILLIESETLLGLWLISGFAPQGAWLMALVAFTLMACFSLHLGIAGESSCGCLGKVSLKPWYSFGLDVAAVAGLLVWRPVDFSVRALRDEWLPRFLRPGLHLASGVGLILVASLTVLWLTSPSLWGALALLRGESLTFEPSVVEIGSGERGLKRDFSLTIHNNSDRSISLVGGHADCHCITTAELPLTVPLMESRTFVCEFLFRGAVGQFQYPFAIYTNDGGYSMVIARVGGRLVESTGR